jgi:hypothetical protein
LFLYFDYWQNGGVSPYKLSSTPETPVSSSNPLSVAAGTSLVFHLTTTQPQFEFTPGTFDATIFCSIGSGSPIINISSITLNQPSPSPLYGEITLFPGSNSVIIPSSPFSSPIPVALTGIIGPPPGGGSVYVVPTNSTVTVTIQITGGTANIDFQNPAGYSLITLSTAVLVQGPVGPTGPTGLVGPTGPTGNNYWNDIGSNNIQNANTGGSVYVNANLALYSDATNASVFVNSISGSLFLGTASNFSIVNVYNSGINVTGIINATGNITSLGNIEAVNFNATSDYRIKENVHALDESDTIDGLRPVKYLNKLTKGLDIGLIAHELQEFYPFLVKGEKDGPENQSVNYIGLIGVLIKEIQMLKARVSKLEKN